LAEEAGESELEELESKSGDKVDPRIIVEYDILPNDDQSSVGSIESEE
jgi:hypothetical protein